MEIPSVEKKLYVTGANAAFFPMLCQLLASFERFAPGVKLWVCDFGLTEGQSRFLVAKGQLLSRPERFAAGWHPYLYKGGLYYYVESLPFDVLTWIDSDCVLTGLFVDAVEQLLAQQPDDGPFLAVTQDLDNNTLDSFIKKNPETTRPFDRLLTRFQLSRHQPYLNCGLFTLRCRETLREWAELTLALPAHFLFEQNTFNSVIYKNIHRIVLWDWATYNVCGAELNRLRILGGGRYPGSVRLDEKRILVVHVAATNQQAALAFEPIILPVERGFLCGIYRFPLNPLLNDYLLGLLVEYTRSSPVNGDLLHDSGALLADNPMISGGEGFAQDPRFAHFFSYGNKSHPEEKGMFGGSIEAG
ncbi:MAG: hypothetical protein HQL67_12620 [Magnetococcales bacterium]|nr:hypothetical protein [Magnetococcales bacterium]